MNSHVARRIVEAQCNLQNGFPGFVVCRKVAAFRQIANGLQDFAHGAMRQAFGEAVHFAWRHAEDFCHFPDGEPRVHGNKAADHGDVFRAPVLVDVIEQFIAARAADINVDVRAIAALFVQETLEIKFPAQRADTRNAEAISDHGTGRRPARNGGNAAAASLFDDVVNQQKIRSELPMLDDCEFVREPRKHFRAQGLVAFASAIEAEFPQIGKGGFAVGNRALREDQFVQSELQVAAVGDFCCRVQPFRMIGETFVHFRGGLEPSFGGGDFGRRDRG